LRWLPAAVLAWTLLGPAAGAASAQPQVDLSTIVLRQLQGYQPTPAGVGPSGPLTAEQLREFAPDDARRTLLDAPGTATYGRSFSGGARRQAVLVGFHLGTVARARSFLGVAREAALDLGDVFPVPGVRHSFRVAVRPERAPGTSTQRAFVQSGPLLFAIVLSDAATSPVTDAHVTQVARTQAAAVPKHVAAQEEASTARDVAREAAYAAAFVLPVALLAGTLLVFRSRR
jgi:hypothetical protein